MCYKPNPHEIDFESDLAEMAADESGGPKFVRKFSLTKGEKSRFQGQIRKFMHSPGVKNLTSAQREELKQRIRALFAQINPHIQLR